MANPIDAYNKCDLGSRMDALDQAERDRFEAEQAFQGAVLRLPDRGELTPAQQADFDKAKADLEAATQRYLDAFETEGLCHRSHTDVSRKRLSPLQEPKFSAGFGLGGASQPVSRKPGANPLDGYQQCRQAPSNAALEQAEGDRSAAELGFQNALRRLPDSGELIPAQQADFDKAKADLALATQRYLDLFQVKFLCQRRYTIVSRPD